MHGYLRHLANFAHIVESGSITGAARRLGSSPSTLSDSVKILEAYLGEPILERRHSGVIPTGRGMSIYAGAKQIVDALTETMSKDETVLAGTLKISVASELLDNWYGEVATEIGRTAPNINLVFATEDDLFDRSKYARDLYVRVGPRPDDRNFTQLAQANAKAILVAHQRLVSGSIANDPEQISQLPLLCSHGPHGSRTLWARDPKQAVVFKKTIQIDSINSRISLMRSGAGVVNCLERTVREEIKRGDVVPLLGTRLETQLFVSIGSPHREPSSAAAYVANQLISAS